MEKKRFNYTVKRPEGLTMMPEPFEVTCQPCGGRGWVQPSMVVGFHPQRCTSCGGTGKVLVR